jgi:hypothetical protein
MSMESWLLLTICHMRWSLNLGMPSVADLTFLPALPRVICRNAKSKAPLGSYIS